MIDVSYHVVRAYVAVRRPEIRTEAGRGPAEVFVPQSHQPGMEADFGEVAIRLRGTLVTCILFSLRLSFSDKAAHKIFLRTLMIFEPSSATGQAVDRSGPGCALGHSSSNTCGAPQFIRQAERMADDGFTAVERRIRAHEGEHFLTRRGLPMTYVVDGDRIKVDRAQPWLSIAQARVIWEMGPDATLTDVDQAITGRAYLFAILRDRRICP